MGRLDKHVSALEVQVEQASDAHELSSELNRVKKQLKDVSPQLAAVTQLMASIQKNARDIHTLDDRLSNLSLDELVEQKAFREHRAIVVGAIVRKGAGTGNGLSLQEDDGVVHHYENEDTEIQAPHSGTDVDTDLQAPPSMDQKTAAVESGASVPRPLGLEARPGLRMSMIRSIF